MFDLKQLFSPDGACAAVLPGWRARPQQLAMAEAVERAVADNSVLLAEAGTGTGKTLAYLIPALLSGGKVVISTGTKALQEFGVPFAALLSALMLMLCIAQVGPSLVLFPAVAWMYWTGDHGWATFLLVWSIVVATLDNFLRPVLIKKGADLPLLLIFAGVIGGLLGFGLIGIFVGPVVLAVTYTLLEAWIEDALGKADPV